MSKEIVYFVGLLKTMTDCRSDEKKMVENSTVGAAYSYYTVYNIDDTALCASRTEFDTEAGYSNCIRCYGYGHIRGAD